MLAPNPTSSDGRWPDDGRDLTKLPVGRCCESKTLISSSRRARLGSARNRLA